MLLKSTRSAQKGIALIKQMRELEGAINTKGGKKKYCLKEVIKLVQAKNTDLQYQVKGDAKIIADEALEVIFDTLSDNAVRHGDAKNIVITIKKLSKGLEIRFSDDGSGIPAEFRDKVFGEGFKAGKHANTGLGLYIVKKTIERYNWQIKIENNLPSGTIFVITT